MAKNFAHRIAVTDFMQEAKNWPGLLVSLRNGLDFDDLLVFVAYFVDEEEWRTLSVRRSAT